MFTDNALSFNTNWQTPQSITTTADSSTIVDVTGAGSGNAPAMIGGNGGVIGEDIGLGDGEAVPWVVVNVTTAGGNNSNTLTISLSGAPDNGSNVAGTYTVYGSTGALVDSALAVGTTIAFRVPRRPPGAALARFYKLTYTASATLTPLAVVAGIVLNPPSSLTSGAYPSNFVAV
jgi:Bbp16